MTDITTLLGLAKSEFAAHRVNKAVGHLLSAVELMAGMEATPAAELTKQALTEPAPAPVAAPEAPVETPAEVEPPVEVPAKAPVDTPVASETTPADLARVLATADLAASQEPAKPAAKKKTTGTRSSDV